MELPNIYNKRLLVNGFNATIRRLANLQGWEGISRVQERPAPGSNVWVNKLFYFRTDEDFNIEEQKLMVDISCRQKFLSFTEGCEDPRFLFDNNQALVVTLDTNNRWKPEMSLIDFDRDTYSINKVKPLVVDGISQNIIQKNWIPLKVDTNGDIIMLHHSFPFRIIRLNMITGIGETIKEYTTVLDDSIIGHNGAALHLHEGGWLVSIRVKSGYKYKHSIWLYLNDEYELIKYSDPFIFRETSFDGTLVSYEMCMSMCYDTNDCIVCSVGISDTHSEVFKYRLEDIHALLVNYL